MEALGASISAGRAIMAWLQTTASRLAEAGLPLDWTTPSGSQCRQSYHVQLQMRIRTLAGKFQVDEPGALLNPRKQAAGAAPNVVHSFDAAHLSMTVVAAVDDGIKSFHMIHDSFGTHAAMTTRLARILREVFVGIYETDWLAKMAADIHAYAPHVELPPLPDRGSFDIQEVLDAAFFFS